MATDRPWFFNFLIARLSSIAREWPRLTAAAIAENSPTPKPMADRIRGQTE